MTNEDVENTLKILEYETPIEIINRQILNFERSDTSVGLPGRISHKDKPKFQQTPDSVISTKTPDPSDPYNINSGFICIGYDKMNNSVNIDGVKGLKTHIMKLQNNIDTFQTDRIISPKKISSPKIVVGSHSNISINQGPSKLLIQNQEYSKVSDSTTPPNANKYGYKKSST